MLRVFVVPFVARIPGGAKAHVVREQVQLFDVMPTILELSQRNSSSRPTTKNTHFVKKQKDPQSAMCPAQLCSLISFIAD